MCLPWKEEIIPAPSSLVHPREAPKGKSQTSKKEQKKKSLSQLTSALADPTLSANERQRRRNREKRYEAVKALRAQGQGLSHYAIADVLGLSRPTVRYFLEAEQFPERRDSPREPRTSVVAPYLPFLRERWLSGCHNGRQLFREAKARGYPGSAAQLERVTTQWRKHLAPASFPLKRQRVSSQQACWYFLISEERLTTEQRRSLAHMCQLSPELALAYELSRNFLQILTQRKAVELTQWLGQAKESRFAELTSLAKSLQQDHAAIAAACSFGSSSV